MTWEWFSSYHLVYEDVSQREKLRYHQCNPSGYGTQRDCKTDLWCENYCNTWQVIPQDKGHYFATHFNAKAKTPRSKPKATMSEVSLKWCNINLIISSFVTVNLLKWFVRKKGNLVIWGLTSKPKFTGLIIQRIIREVEITVYLSICLKFPIYRVLDSNQGSHFGACIKNYQCPLVYLIIPGKYVFA